MPLRGKIQTADLFCQVGGAAVDDDVGALVGLQLKPTGTDIKKRITTASGKCRSPIIAGALTKKQDTLYLALQNGEVVVYDIEKNEFTRTFPRPNGRYEITHMVADKDQDGLWMAFRREDGEIKNWCFQEYFRLPNLVSQLGAYTG
jgi:hypothetical protein